MAKTLYDKIWENHEIKREEDGTSLIYIDRHLVHEVTSPQAFEGLRLAKREIRQLSKVLSVADHNTPTHTLSLDDCNDSSKIQLETLNKNAKEFNLRYYPLGDKNNGVCHVVAPEKGFVLPGATLVCGDSHTATHGAFGAIAFGIGTSEVEHVFATQTLRQKPVKNMRITIDGTLEKAVTAKDIALFVISQIGTAGGTGYAIEFAGSGIESLSMEQRMTLCNMGIEGGARVAIVAPDQTTFDYLKDKPLSPKGENWEKAVAFWKSLHTDTGAKFDKEYTWKASEILPQVTWGTSPEDCINVTQSIPKVDNPTKERALKYVGLNGGDKIAGTPINWVFIGSCTNGRIEDFRSASQILKGKKVAPNVRAIAVPGSGLVKEQAEKEGLDVIFKNAGFEWRLPGCSMCLAMNPDFANPEERVASTSNRNFEGRQGYLSRTHLMNPAMAAAAAIEGKIADARQYL